MYMHIYIYPYMQNAHTHTHKYVKLHDSNIPTFHIYHLYHLHQSCSMCWLQSTGQSWDSFLVNILHQLQK